MNNSAHPVVFFDGVCNLCNRTVQFIIRHDKKGVFRFASLQSKAGEEAKVRAEKQSESGSRKIDSIILFYKGSYYTKSSAALKIGMLLGGIGWLLVPGYIFPSFIRDAVYDVIAKRRYQWFGKRDECMIPTPELKARFLDE
jgi:predicted DCC family thiol-disulfide oxidoreductase YuxK